jgi:LuxR family maltose regulon positive regulatory protein
VTDFMLATSILDELSGPACAALAGDASAALLEQLRNGHMFVTLVDNESRTYRYHHLIRDVLRAELHARDPARERSLQAAAANYFVGCGELGRAARHLMAAGDPPAAFKLLSEWLIRDFTNNPQLSRDFDFGSIEPEHYADVPEILLPLAAELLLRGGFERGSRALILAQQAHADLERQPENVVRLAAVSGFHCFAIGELEQALSHRDAVHQMEPVADGISDWFDVLDAMAMYCYTYLGEFSEARRLSQVVASSPAAAPPVTEVLIPGVMSQVAWREGDLLQARQLAELSLNGAGRLGFDQHYFAFPATRTCARLALERRDISAASDLLELSLSSLVAGRPMFDYLTQLDRARVWAADGHPEEAMSSLPSARAALRSERSVLLVQADELECRFRLMLGDHAGAVEAARRLPDDRRSVMSAIIALAVGDPKSARDALGAAPGQGATIRSDLEQRLLRAAVAIEHHSYEAPRLVREALGIVDRYGFVQTVLETSPQLVATLISDSARYPSSENVAALIAAGLHSRKLTTVRSSNGGLADPLTDAEKRVLEKLPQRLTYADMASDLYLSLNTVKTHLRHTYMKLGVSSRSAAIKRATSLGLL